MLSLAQSALGTKPHDSLTTNQRHVLVCGWLINEQADISPPTGAIPRGYITCQ